jgi:aminoglycoside/choline kinase family phosphotransferase
MTSTAGRNLSARLIEITASYLDAPADQLTITHLTGDASTRSYFRAASSSASLVIALYTEPFEQSEQSSHRLERAEQFSPTARLTFANDPCAHIEVTELFLKAGLPVPALVRVSGDEAAILIEDVGDIKLQDWLLGRSTEEVKEAYLRAIDFIIKIQEATEIAVESDSICCHLAFDEAKLRWELGFFFAHYFNRYLKVKIDAARSNAAQEDFRAICSELASRERVLTHRDYHARNLMMSGERMFTIDHQDARLGPATYDLASLIADPYTSLDSEVTEELIEKFIELKSRSSQPISDEGEFRKELDLMTIQRMLKAVGTYSFQAAMKDNTVYVQYIAPALDRAIAAMQRLGRFNRTRALLEETRGQ